MSTNILALDKLWIYSDLDGNVEMCVRTHVASFHKTQTFCSFHRMEPPETVAFSCLIVRKPKSDPKISIKDIHRVVMADYGTEPTVPNTQAIPRQGGLNWFRLNMKTTRRSRPRQPSAFP